MMRRYVLSQKAENDLATIYRYSFLTHGEQKADWYAESLRQKCVFLSENPFLHRVRSEFTPSVRIHHHEKHLIVHTVYEDHIFIVRFLHERMDIEPQLEA